MRDKTTGYDIAVPLYEIPAEVWLRVKSAIRLQCTTVLVGNFVKVLVAPPELEQVEVGPKDDPFSMTVGDWRYLYTPTSDEVCRALRGPQGYPGPKGDMGEPGTPGSDEIPEKYRARIESNEKMVDAHTRVIANMAIKMTQKEEK